MRTLEFIVEPDLAPATSLAEDRHFLHVVTRPSWTRTGVLRVYDFPNDVLSLGRYHLAPKPAPTNQPVHVCRRHSGGRMVPFGEGFVGVALVLPHRSALVGDLPFALAPYQIMNRCVRGILEGCRLVNMAAFYPGRDFVTIGRRLAALVSFEVDQGGALLFEAIIANRRDFSVLPVMLDAVDTLGVMKADLFAPRRTTCLARELGVELSFGEVAEMIRRGFEKQFDLKCEDHEITPLEARAISATASHEFSGDRWLRQRSLRSDLDHHSLQRGQLGLFEAYFSIEQDRFLKEVSFVGDFIANSSSIEILERELRLCPVEWRAIDAVASQVFAQPENYILGIGPIRTIADTICKGMAT